MSESVCLQWNDFPGNIRETFRTLKDDKDFTDVTLVCEDGVQIEVRKVILISSSPVFASLLKIKKHPQSLIYMRGLNSGELQTLVDFLYLGETTVQEEDVENFLELGKEFQLKGLTESLPHLRETMPLTIKKPKFEKIQKDLKNLDIDIFNEKLEDEKLIGKINSSIPTETIENLDEEIKSLVELSNNMLSNGKQRASKCKVCGKEGLGGNIKTHIEVYHLQVLIPCTTCERVFKSRAFMKAHNCKQQKDGLQKFDKIVDDSFYV